MKLKIILSTLLLCLLFSCKKKSEDVPTKTDYLTKGSWKRIKYEIKNATTYDVINLDIPPYACRKDDFITFKKDNTFVIDNGTIQCANGEPRYENGTWAFGNNETTLMMTYATFNTIQDIEIINDNSLVLSYSNAFKRNTYSH
jgi:Lipocalin-like domain